MRVITINPKIQGGLPCFAGTRVPASSLFDHLKKGYTVAAFIAEPVQGSGGLIVPPDEYFPRIREICDKYNVLFIADEIITGFGRTGRWFGLERYGIEPDMIAFGKKMQVQKVSRAGIEKLAKTVETLAQREGLDAHKNAISIRFQKKYD